MRYFNWQLLYELLQLQTYICTVVIYHGIDNNNTYKLLEFQGPTGHTHARTHARTHNLALYILITVLSIVNVTNKCPSLPEFNKEWIIGSDSNGKCESTSGGNWKLQFSILSYKIYKFGCFIWLGFKKQKVGRHRSLIEDDVAKFPFINGVWSLFYAELIWSIRKI